MREEVKEREVRLSMEGGESRGEKGGGGGMETWHMIINNRAEVCELWMNVHMLVLSAEEFRFHRKLR